MIVPNVGTPVAANVNDALEAESDSALPDLTPVALKTTALPRSARVNVTVYVLPSCVTACASPATVAETVPRVVPAAAVISADTVKPSCEAEPTVGASAAANVNGSLSTGFESGRPVIAATAVKTIVSPRSARVSVIAYTPLSGVTGVGLAVPTATSTEDTVPPLGTATSAVTVRPSWLTVIPVGAPAIPGSTSSETPCVTDAKFPELGVNTTLWLAVPPAGTSLGDSQSKLPGTSAELNDAEPPLN